MKKSIIVCSLALIFVSGCFAPKSNSQRLSMESSDFKPHTQKIEKVVLIANGEPGQSFVAELDVDGKKQNFQVNTPGSIHLQTCVTVGTIRKTGGDGSLSFTIRPDKEQVTHSVSFGNLRKKGQSLEFRYHNKGVKYHQ